MQRVLPLLVALLALPSAAFATWPVIAVDRGTGRLVTCVNGDDQFPPGVQAVVVPGQGVAACQASVDSTHQNQMLVFRELQKVRVRYDEWRKTQPGGVHVRGLALVSSSPRSRDSTRAASRESTIMSAARCLHGRLHAMTVSRRDVLLRRAFWRDDD
jgi:hypothetical protein